MKLSDREKTWVRGGGIAVGVVVLVAGILLPLGRKWSDLGAQLGPKLKRVEEITERARRRDELLERRSQLASALGSLTGAEAATGAAPSKPSGASSSEAERSRQGAGKEEVKPAALQVPASLQSATGSASPADGAAGNPMNAQQGSPPASGTSGDRGVPQASGGASRDASQGSVSFAAYLERTAKKAGLNPKRLHPKRLAAPSQEQYFARVSIQMSFDCNVQSLITFLHELEKGPRLARIEQLDLRRDIKKNSMDVTVDVVGYEAKVR